MTGWLLDVNLILAPFRRVSREGVKLPNLASDLALGMACKHAEAPEKQLDVTVNIHRDYRQNVSQPLSLAP